MTVLVRSYNRPREVAELLGALVAQDHDSFEVVVVEQTPDLTGDQLARLETLWADPRVRVLRRPPLGGARARNEGFRAARGRIVIMIDDDDLPASRDWIAKHEAHYRQDPNLAGLSARQVRAVGEACPYPDWTRPIIRLLAMRFSPLGIPHISLPRFDEDLDGADWVNGTNGSVRREVALRGELWDETVFALEEHSFGFKFARSRRPGEYLAFRAEPTIVRRIDVEGGMNKRNGSIRKELLTNLLFSHRIVRRYHPIRFRLLYPAYLVSAFGRTVAFVWDYEWFKESTPTRIWRTFEVLGELPSAVWSVLRSKRSERTA